MEDCSRLNQSVKVLSAKISSKDLDAIQSIYDRNLTQIDSTIEALQKKGAYQDSSYLINAALNL